MKEYTKNEEYKYTFVPRRGTDFTYDSSMVFPIANGGTTKPSGGFWLSVNEDWESWCEFEEPGWIDGKMQYVVTISDNANILKIDSMDCDSLLVMNKEIINGFEPCRLIDLGEDAKREEAFLAEIDKLLEEEDYEL